MWVSNHGGRQLDGAVTTAEALRRWPAAVGGRAEVYVDGGVRTGVDVLRALALGARAVFVGRPALWSLVDGRRGRGGGRAGTELTGELAHAMGLAGVTSVEGIDRGPVPPVAGAGIPWRGEGPFPGGATTQPSTP